MKLVHATIYGFGKWIDYSIDLSSESAICIYGDNESGKSTLQKFILFMLFGLPPKKRAFYRPKTSGKIGGKLEVYDQTTGNYTIERLDEVQNGAATCFTSDGMVHDESWLKDRLQGMTYETYQSIFSFSAIDLSQVRNMKEDDLGEVLLGIGLSGSNNIYAIEKKINTKMGALFKPYGKKPIMNQQLESLRALFNTLHHLKSEETTYRDKKGTATVLTDKLKQLQSTLKKEKLQRTAIEKQLHALPTMHAYDHHTAQLAQYPETIQFPEDGVNRLEKIKEKLLPLESELAVLKSNEQRYREKINHLQTAQTDDAAYKEAACIMKEQQAYEETKKTLKKTEENLNKLILHQSTEMDQLNMGLQQTDIEALHFPFHIEYTWQQLKKDADQVDLEKDQLQQEENTLKHQRNYLLNQMQELDDGCLPEDQLQQLRDQVNQYQEFDVVQKLRKESDLREQTWKDKMTEKQKNHRTSFIGAVVFSLIAGLGAVAFTNNWLYVVMVMLLLMGVVQWLWGKHTVKEMTEMLASDAAQLSPSHVSVTEAQKEAAKQQLSLHEQNQTAYQALKEQEKTSDIQQIKWNEKKKMLEEREKRLYEQIDEQVKAYPFLQYADVAFWPEVYHRLKRIVDLNEEQKGVAGEVKQLHGKLEAFETKVANFLQSINKYQSNEAIDFKLEMIGAQQATEADIKQQISQYESLLKDVRDQQRDTKQKVQPYKQEREALFASAQVDTENAYYETANQLAEKRQTLKAQEKLKRQLDSMYPELVDECMANETDQDQLMVKQQQTLDTIDEKEQQIEEIRQELAAVNAALSAMESSEAYSETMHQYAMEQEHVNKLAKEWAVLKTAKEMLVETMRIYRDKYLNKVMEATTAYFRHITGNGYQTVYAPVGDQPFQVETKDAIRYTVNELSQGTVDQLYVSLRMAISETMSEKHSLPFIIDDAFVHFDAVRTTRMMEVLEDIGRKQQMIIFTCKKETVASTKDAKVVRLTDSIRINA